MITVPQSVFAYFHEPDVSTAVDLLVDADFSRKKKPPIGGLRWDQVATYYRACLAARQTPIEFAIFTEALWRAAWVDIPTVWTPLTPDDVAGTGCSTEIAYVWSERIFSRRFEQAGYALELYAGAWADEGAQIGLALLDKEGTEILVANDLNGWEHNEEYDNFWTPAKLVPLSSTIDTSAFTTLATEALSAVHRAMQTR